MSTRAVLPFLALLLVACAGPDEGGDPDGVAHVGSGTTPSPAIARALAASLEPVGGGVLEDGLVRRRVAALAAEVAAAAGAPGCDLTVLDTTQVVARALPGGHLQVSRGLLVACAGESAGDRVAALLAHLAGHVAVDPSGGVRLSGVAPLDSSSWLTQIVEGRPEAWRDAAPLCEAFRDLCKPQGPIVDCDAADARALRALEELGLPQPVRALETAYAALAAVEERDPTAVAPFVGAHGALVHRLRAAREATPAIVESRPAAREPLDLTPLVAEVEDAATLDAVDHLTRTGAPDAALRLLGERRGARASTLRGLALSALGREREAERAWRAALLLDPGAHRARVALAALYVRQGQRDAARAELDIALRRAPLDPEVHLLLGVSESDAAVATARYKLVRALTAGDGPIGRKAVEALAPRQPIDPTPPDPRRTRILSGSGGGD